MWKAQALTASTQALTASTQASSLSVAAVQVAAAEEREWVEVENAALSQAVTCLKDLVLEGSAQENRVQGAYSARVTTIGVKTQGDVGPCDDWEGDIWCAPNPPDLDPGWLDHRHHVATVRRVVRNYGPAPAGGKIAPSTGRTVAETELTLHASNRVSKNPGWPLVLWVQWVGPGHGHPVFGSCTEPS
ncbi:hypothetical protein KIL84_011364 [Mauremys mutica]|uniref:Uncharacterized protein n=1 Tax=Mauremys mutica TaxID=74926 RepID=A0A9D3XDL9_9SAUR|nr:hypothetical protein KIL84_011364 [Mauremys mutica]